jgi:hypothetical protein
MDPDLDPDPDAVADPAIFALTFKTFFCLLPVLFEGTFTSLLKDIKS